VQDTIFSVACVVLALESLHSRKIVYRDLKPENILLGKDGYLKVTDFGNAKEISGRTYTLCGTPDYMSPEIWLNKGHSFPADNWALGVFTYELLYGETPFESRADEKQSEQIEKIIKAKVTYSKWMSPDSVDFMKSLIKAKVANRLGSGKEGTSELKSHPWFKDVNWKALSEKKVKPPYVPTPDYIKNATADFNEPGVGVGIEDENLGEVQMWIEGF
jgi:serine/threonine protein kinase